jgi:hypothetical protein
MVGGFNPAKFHGRILVKQGIIIQFPWLKMRAHLKPPKFHGKTGASGVTYY